MKTTITVNIGGLAFTMEEDGFIRLDQYLKTLKAKLGNNGEADEVVADIESRMAELFSRTHNGPELAINLEEVNEVIAIIGDVEEFESEPANQSQSQNRKSSQRDSDGDKTPQLSGAKRLYRDLDNRVLGGVCSGLGCYLGLDPVFVRIVMLILLFFGGLSIWIYLLLWIIIPAARSFAQKIEMYGQVGSDGKFASQPQPYYASSGLAQILNIAMRVIAIVLGVAFSLAAFVVLLVGFGIVAVVPQFLGEANHGLFNLITNNLLGGTNFVMAFIGVFLLLLIPAILLLYGGARLLKNPRSSIRFLVPASVALWILALLLLIFAGARIGGQFATESSTSTTHLLVPTKAKTLVITNSGNFKESDEELLFGAYDAEKNILLGRPTFRIEQGDSLRIEVKRFSRGHSSSEAFSNAKLTSYQFVQSDSILKLDDRFVLSSLANLRQQRVEVVITIPDGMSIFIDPNIKDRVEHVNMRLTAEPLPTPRGLKQGLKFAYYEGELDELPDFSALTPIHQGSTQDFNLKMPHREDNFAIVYTGFIYVPENGVYSIYSNSDDGSKVFINDQLVVNNDGLHGARFEYVSMNLTKGYYAVRVEYFDRELDQVLEVGYWTDHSRSMPFGKEQLFYND